MREFLGETLELFYWAMWYPSRLEKEVGKLTFSTILNPTSSDFIPYVSGLVITMILFLNIPLYYLAVNSNRPIDWAFLVLSALISYTSALLFFHLSFLTIEIFFFAYNNYYTILEKELNRLADLRFDLIPSIYLNSDFIGKISIFILVLGVLNFILYTIVRKRSVDTGMILVALGIIFTTVGLTGVGITGIVDKAPMLGYLFFSFLSFIAIWLLINSNFSRPLLKIFLLVLIFNGPVIYSLEILRDLPVRTLFLPVCITSFIFSSTRNSWGEFSLITYLVMLNVLRLELSSTWLVPLSLLIYFRLFPDYFFSVLLSIYYIFSSRSGKLISRYQTSGLCNPVTLLRQMQFFGIELAWFPIPWHKEIIESAFKFKPIHTLRNTRKFQLLRLPIYHSTIAESISYIVRSQLEYPKCIAPLLKVTNDVSKFLSGISPYLSISDNQGYLRDGSLLCRDEVDLIFPRIQNISTDLSNALSTSTITLRERGLNRVVQDLIHLQENLLNTGLTLPAIKNWTPTLYHWQHLIELEIQEQQKKSQGELLNPFQFGNPVRPSRENIFQGRRLLAERLYRLILDRDRPTLVLYGTRRAGKTSFLLNLFRFLPSDLIPIYLDLQSSAITSSEADFCYGLTRAIHKDSKDQGVELPPPSSRDDFKENPYGTLEDWFKDALPKIEGNRRLLLNLDEFEKLGSAIKSGRLSLSILDELRHLIQHYDQLAFMFSGVQTLDELGPNWSNYFISVVPIEMGYLEPNEAEDLLRNPDPDFKMRYADGVVQEILRLTCCQPYLVQLIGSCLVNQANQNQTQLATLDLLEAAIPDAFTNGEPYFINLWTEFTGTTPVEVTAGQQILIALVSDRPKVIIYSPTSPLPHSQTARRRMIRFHLITEENAIEIPLFERWIIDRAIET